MATPGCARPISASSSNGIAHRVGFPVERIVLGGDHLGPNRWRTLPAATAMSHADELVRSYVVAGYTKLHLDCSYPCADDSGTSHRRGRRRPSRPHARGRRSRGRAGRAGRAAALRDRNRGARARRCRRTKSTNSCRPPPRVPRTTLAAHRLAFDRAGLGHVWPQVMALVVQPGVEFDHLQVVDYRAGAAR